MQQGLAHCDFLVFLLYQYFLFESLSTSWDHCCFSVSFLGLGEGGEGFRGRGEGFRGGGEGGLADSFALFSGLGLLEAISPVILFTQNVIVGFASKHITQAPSSAFLCIAS